MSGTTIGTEGIADLELILDRFPLAAPRAMSVAINETARDVAMPAAKREITAQVNFPFGYLDNGDRLAITQFATPTRLEAKVTGRGRGTSLNRFVTGTLEGTAQYGRGLTVMVKPGDPRRMPRAFRVGLNSANVGVAIRLKPGEKVSNIREYNPIMLWKDVYLLYGPSVDQVFKTVAEDIAPEITTALETEFMRQFNLRISGQVND